MLKSQRVMVSDETLAKQRETHPELTLTDYKALPDIVDKGLVIQSDDQRLLFLRKGKKW